MASMFKYRQRIKYRMVASKVKDLLTLFVLNRNKIKRNFFFRGETAIFQVLQIPMKLLDFSMKTSAKFNLRKSRFFQKIALLLSEFLNKLS